MKILVTGTAGFIGFSLARRLLSEGHEIVGVDNYNPYYSVELKRKRVALLKAESGARFEEQDFDLCDLNKTRSLVAKGSFDRIVHLAAQAGVRHSLKDPHAYLSSNLQATLNILEAARHARSPHLVYASTSSVYGIESAMPFKEDAPASHPASLYAATKRANELMAHSFSHLFELPTTGLRFFTVYGPWGRPDMALFEFTKRILADEPIEIFNHGRHVRDFTYIDDIVEGIARVSLGTPPRKSEWDAKVANPSLSSAPFKVYNIGNGTPVSLMEFVGELERCLGKKAKLVELPLQPGDVEKTHADVSALERDFGYKARTPVREGVKHFVSWYLEAYGRA